MGGINRMKSIIEQGGEQGLYDIKELSSKKLLTVDEAASYVGICKTSMRNLIYEDRFPALVRIGHKRGRIFINREKLDKWIDSKTGF
jgi:excisionase family DNA binding protein